MSVCVEMGRNAWLVREEKMCNGQSRVAIFRILHLRLGARGRIFDSLVK